MATIVVYTDKGEQVWQTGVDSYMLAHAKCPGNTTGTAIISAMRRAVADAEAIDAGRAARLAEEEIARRREQEPDMPLSPGFRVLEAEGG